ncbi:hypothetical protein MTO96_022605 [Rhipicephalus appendiculatus]
MQVFVLVLSLGLASSFLKVQSRYVSDEGAARLHHSEESVRASSSNLGRSSWPMMSEDTARADESAFEDLALRLMGELKNAVMSARKGSVSKTEITELRRTLQLVEIELKQQLDPLDTNG